MTRRGFCSCGRFLGGPVQAPDLTNLAVHGVRVGDRVGGPATSSFPVTLSFPSWACCSEPPPHPPFKHARTRAPEQRVTRTHTRHRRHHHHAALESKSPQGQSSWDLSRQTQPMALDEQIRRRFLDFYTTFEGGLTVGCHKNVRPRIVIADPRTPHRASNLKLS